MESLGGPLIAVPVSLLAEWGGCSENWGEESSPVEDYDRACAVEGWAGLLDVGRRGGQALVLADEPATSRYLPEQPKQPQPPSSSTPSTAHMPLSDRRGDGAVPRRLRAGR
ncbi:Imm21 family immunity protein [Streptomyces telluris]|uniref:Immunity 21 family protein n=1 Tax=Streptomyces telluris TaxID=2720021 RepID=A0A9X2RR80_9ACTN|nr:Imm21 family immunity protein [Streptomyces telluris]MCQ8773070.1 immunity 21 family protein [Streptomyces telluris]NJP82228.1 hypothetical protein [Streptomyces telluris]